jgi:hypothetical protein
MVSLWLAGALLDAGFPGCLHVSLCVCVCMCVCVYIYVYVSMHVCVLGWVSALAVQASESLILDIQLSWQHRLV